MLSIIAIILWLTVGTVLSWLLKDFGRSLEPEMVVFPPALVFLLFALFAYVIARFSWNTFNDAKSEKEDKL
jgi:hypothetical protein